MADPITSDPSRPVLAREPLVTNGRSMSWISNKICGIVENRQPALWWYLFIPSVLLMGVLGYCLAYLVTTGVGVWGNNHPVGWGWAITNFVFLDRYWTCRYFDFSNFVFDAPKVEDSCSPGSRGDDNLCCDVCRYFPGLTRWSFLDGLVLGSRTQC